MSSVNVYITLGEKIAQIKQSIKELREFTRDEGISTPAIDFGNLTDSEYEPVNDWRSSSYNC